MLISVENVTFGYNGVPIVENADFAINEGDRIGFVGGNGEGKTTFLKLLTGELTPDAGSVVKRRDLALGYLPQSGGFESDASAYDAMKEVFREDEELLLRLREAENALSLSPADLPLLSAKIESYHKRIAARDSYHFDVKIRTVLSGMGFDGKFRQPVSTMSGGEKTRLKLCRLLLEAPSLLILDEPTNHLDLKTLFWLEDYLASYRGALLVVSHDRYFLDRLTSRTLELEHGKLTAYKGSYAKYKLLKEEKYKQELRAYERQCEERLKLQTYIDKNIVRATTAKSALSRVNRLERMEEIDKPVPPTPPPRFRFEFDTPPYERVLRAEHFNLEAGGHTLLKDASLTLMRGEKCALVGDNGTGKSSLLEFLLTSGRAEFGRFVKTAYFDQENAQIDPAERVLDAYWGKHPRLSQTEARAALARVGFSAEDIFKTGAELSGGMRAKLALAFLEAERANFLVLDEPTNHLDLPAREALEDALCAFGGTLLFVSHDRRFIERIATCVAAIEGGTLQFFHGPYEAYLAQKKPAPPPPEKEKSAGYGREERVKKARERERIAKIEARLTQLGEEQQRLNEELIGTRDYRRINEIVARLQEIETESAELYEASELQ